MSLFKNVTVAPADPILGITAAYNADTSPLKVNLGVGAYRDDDGLPYVLKVVQKAEAAILAAGPKKYNKEYIPIEGLAAFNSVSQQLIFGPTCQALLDKRIATCQSLSGTGALRIGAEFIKRWIAPKGDSAQMNVLISDPTWGNHLTIFGEQGLKVTKYRYFDPRNNGLNFDGMCEDFKNAPNGSVIVLHVCAHNPTGVDPSQDQWNQIADIFQEKQHIPFFDCAYQGYASGNPDVDAFSIRLFVSRGFECFLAQSFAKNFGLYGERVGAFSVVCASQEIAEAVVSQVKLIVRPMYSSPPVHGARIVSHILSTPELYKEWLDEVKMMSERIIEMRRSLYTILKETTKEEWSHIINQIGMFTYTGLKENQVEILINKYHIHMMKNGRISMAGLNTKNVKYVADSIANVVQEPSLQKL